MEQSEGLHAVREEDGGLRHAARLERRGDEFAIVGVVLDDQDRAGVDARFYAPEGRAAMQPASWRGKCYDRPIENNLFVGGFPYETSEEELRRLFGACGTVTSVKILVDRETRRSRGLAFVTMGTDDEGRKAMAELDGSTVGGRPIFVTVARPKEERGEAPPRPEAAPGFVERRSGKDRRQGWGPQPQGGERRGFGGPKPFERERKPWAKKPFDRERKPWDKERKPFDRERKPWDKDRKPFERERKPFDKDRKPFDRDRKPFDKDRKPFDKDRKPFDKDRKPFDKGRPPFGGRKKWGPGGPSSGQKPGQFKRRKPQRPG